MWTLLLLIEPLMVLLFTAAVVAGIVYAVRKQHSAAGPNAAGGDWYSQLTLFLQANDPYLQTMRELQRLIAQAQQQQSTGANAPQSPGIPTELQAQFQAKLFQAQQHMIHMDQMSRERCELSRAGMLSQASSIGIDVSGW